MSDGLFINFEEQHSKMEKLCDKNHLEFSLLKESFPIIMTISPIWEEAAQEKLEFQNMEEPCPAKTDPEATIKFIFGEELTISTANDFLIDEALFGKIKNIAKKMHYAYLQLYFAHKKEMNQLSV